MLGCDGTFIYRYSLRFVFKEGAERPALKRLTGAEP